MDLTVNILIHKKFFFPIDKYKFDRSLLDIVKNNFKFNKNIKYFIHRDRIFFNCINSTKMPNLGWKIHISASYWNAKEILDKTSRYCITNGLNFKFYLDERIILLMNQKNTNRSNSGKFITIYLNEEKDILMHLKGLNDALDKNFEAPYILTDKRYNKNIYYRYGYFIYSDSNIIYNPKNKKEYFVDDRTPYFQLPPWIEDPFKSDISSDEDNNDLLNNRYKILDALHFSNSGGVYLAIDLKTNEKIILKEARPFTSQLLNKHIFDLKENEKQILIKLENHNISFVPKFLNEFKEWEHYYLVQTFEKGITLSKYRLENNPFIKPNRNKQDFDKYYIVLKKIMLDILNKINKLHNLNIVLNDISLSNFLIDDQYKISFVDFDGAIDLSKPEYKLDLSTYSFTPMNNVKDKYINDYISLGLLFYSFLIPNENIFKLNKKQFKILDYLSKEYYLPYQIKEAIVNLINGKYNDSNINELILKLNENSSNGAIRKLKSITLQDYIILLNNTIYKLLVKNLKTVISPSISGNIYSFKYGQAGIIYTLSQVNIIEKSKINFLLSHLENNLKNVYGYNFVDGLAGVLYTLLSNNIYNVNIKKYCYDLIGYTKSTLKNSNIDFSYETGLSGIGVVLLKAYKVSNDKNYLDIVEQIAKNLEIYKEYIVKSISKIGFSSGSAGIANFFIKLYKMTNLFKYYQIGEFYLLNDLKNYHKIDDIYYYNFIKSDKNIFFPYFGYGNAGLLYVTLKFYEEKHSNTLYKYIYYLFNGTKVHFAINLGFEKGLSGILYSQIIYGDIIDNTYSLKKLVQNIILNTTVTPQKVYVPGFASVRFSIDFASGASGLLFVLNKLFIMKGNNYVKIF